MTTAREIADFIVRLRAHGRDLIDAAELRFPVATAANIREALALAIRERPTRDFEVEALAWAWREANRERRAAAAKG